MGSVKLWLSVHDAGASLHGDGVLFTRIMQTDFAPGEGSTLCILPDRNDYGGCPHRVKRVYWDPSGLLNVELVDFFIDPSDALRRVLDYQQHGAWSSGRGNLQQRLVSTGWVLAES